MSSSLGRIETVPLGDRTVAAIRAAIINGELPGGTPLSDRELSESLGVSRTPVREALHRLKEVGLVEPRGRTGWAVTHFTEKDVREIFQLRKVLEPVGLEELERSRDPLRTRELSRFFEDYAHPIETERYRDYFEEDQRFHKAIVACSGNSRLQYFYDVIEGHINRGRYFLSGAAAGRVEETLDEHLSVARAIGEGDFARARNELLLHLNTGEELMIKQLRQHS